MNKEDEHFDFEEMTQMLNSEIYSTVDILERGIIKDKMREVYERRYKQQNSNRHYIECMGRYGINIKKVDPAAFHHPAVYEVMIPFSKSPVYGNSIAHVMDKIISIEKMLIEKRWED